MLGMTNGRANLGKLADRVTDLLVKDNSVRHDDN
jgi:hypothetical protein